MFTCEQKLSILNEDYFLQKYWQRFVHDRLSYKKRTFSRNSFLSLSVSDPWVIWWFSFAFSFSKEHFFKSLSNTAKWHSVLVLQVRAQWNPSRTLFVMKTSFSVCKSFWSEILKKDDRDVCVWTKWRLAKITIWIRMNGNMVTQVLK